MSVTSFCCDRHRATFIDRRDDFAADAPIGLEHSERIICGMNMHCI